MGTIKKKFVAIGAILFLMYNVVLFAIAGFSGHEAAFWISYAFVIVAFAMAALTAGYLGKSGRVLCDWLFGFPIIRHCVIYVTAATLISILFMILEYDVGWVLPTIIQVVLLGLYAVLMLTCFISKDAIEEVGQRAVKKTQYMALLRADAEMLFQKCSDPELKVKCKKLAEDIRFSDPMSVEALEYLERELQQTLMECGKAMDEGNYVLAGELCHKASLQLSERNMKCKILK